MLNGILTMILSPIAFGVLYLIYSKVLSVEKRKELNIYSFDLYILYTVGILLTVFIIFTLMGFDSEYLLTDSYFMTILVCSIILFFIVYSSNASHEKHIENVKNLESKLKNRNFITSQNISSDELSIRTDTRNKKVAICTIKAERIRILKFSEIIECEIIEDSNTIMKGGIGRAIVGGVVAGGIGAIVGANTRASKNVVNSLQIRIVTSNINDSLITLNLISFETKKDGLIYAEAINFANKVYATFTSIMNENSKNNQIEKTTEKKEEKAKEPYAELEKLHELKEKGIITEQEFEEKKKQLLEKI